MEDGGTYRFSNYILRIDQLNKGSLKMLFQMTTSTNSFYWSNHIRSLKLGPLHLSLNEMIFYSTLLGIVTNLNYGNTVSILTTSLTWAHEMGHNFGSPHDTTSNCINQPGGNYIMYPQATDGSQTNNRLFSPCSIASMTAVIEAKGSSTDGCFTAQSGVAFCGNGIVEGI